MNYMDLICSQNAEEFVELVKSNGGEMKESEVKLLKAYDARKLQNIAWDISGHMDVLLKYGRECKTIVEFGTCRGTSTLCWILSKPTKIICIDIDHQPLYAWDIIKEFIVDFSIDLRIVTGDSRTYNIEETTELLFIDTIHEYNFLLTELRSSGNKATKYLIFHDTVFSPGCYQAVEVWCKENSHWKIKEHFTHNHGLTICERKY